jgi:hypothetical protein
MNQKTKNRPLNIPEGFLDKSMFPGMEKEEIEMAPPLTRLDLPPLVGMSFRRALSLRFGMVLIALLLVALIGVVSDRWAVCSTYRAEHLKPLLPSTEALLK